MRPSDHRPGFPATRWSLVARFQEGSQEALAELCAAYWYPVYGFIRRWGHGVADAEDLTQEFFLRVIERGVLDDVGEERGKLRSFLCVLLKRFLADDLDFKNAAKRGGKATWLSIDAEAAEGKLAGELRHEASPERFFDRQWAMTLLSGVLEELGEEYASSGKAALFEGLKGTLSVTGKEQPYAEIAGQLGMTENAIKIAAYRIRQRYRQLLHQRILETVESPDDVAGEIEYLCSTFRRN